MDRNKIFETMININDLNMDLTGSSQINRTWEHPIIEIQLGIIIKK